MIDYNLAKDAKRLLTEKVLGECWHEWKSVEQDPHGMFPYDGFFCKKCRSALNRKPTRRSFTTPQDAHDLMVKLVDIGEWNAFEVQAMFWSDVKMEDFTKWLFAEPESPARFCWLCWKFMEEKS